MNRLEPEVDAPYGTPLKIYTPFLLKPRILPELVSTTVSRSEQTTVPGLLSIGFCEIVEAEFADGGAKTGLTDPAARTAILFSTVRRLEGSIDSTLGKNALGDTNR